MRRDIWVFLFFLGLVLFGWPVMGIFRGALPMYLFIAWFAFIALIFITTAYSEKEDGGG